MTAKLVNILNTTICVVMTLLVLSSYMQRSMSRHLHQILSEQAIALQQISPLLRHLLVCVTFHWNVQKLIFLQVSLESIRTFKTNVDIMIVTDEREKLSHVITSWGYIDVILWQFEPMDQDPNAYSLVWGHKDAIEDRLEQCDSYTTVLYIEDDTRVTWPTLTSWALDTEVLSPLNLSRCFYRTEVHPDSGDRHMLDWTMPLRIESEGRPLDVAKKNMVGYHAVAERIHKLACAKEPYTSPLHPCRLHRHFISPKEPFQGMWIATRKQLAEYMNHSLWKKNDALRAEIPFGFNYAERSNSLNILVNVPTGYLSTCMVPYDGRWEHPSLTWEANIDHMRNGYSTSSSSPHGKLPFSEALAMG